MAFLGHTFEHIPHRIHSLDFTFLPSDMYDITLTSIGQCLLQVPHEMQGLPYGVGCINETLV